MDPRVQPRQKLALPFVRVGAALAFAAAAGLAALRLGPASGWLAVGVTLFWLAACGLALLRLYVGVARPVTRLSAAMRRYQAGEFGTRLPVDSSDEVGHLAAAFDELAGKVDSMVADLRKLDELKSEFLSTVSHELRTPLTSIGGYAKLLVRGEAGTINETQREFLQIIDDNVARLSQLINDLLDVEKMEAGKVQLIKAQLDLRDVLRECADTIGVLARQKGLDLRLTFPEEPVLLVGDRYRLIQIFMNLLSNAIKYTPRGFVALEIERQGPGVCVRVRDSGVGLSAEDQARLFEKFFRARGGLESGEGGTGLGLVIARGLAEAHGGRVAVESRPGEGTTFTVMLPALSSTVAAERTEAERYLNAAFEDDLLGQLLTPGARAGRRRIAIIDPNARDAEWTRECLEGLQSTAAPVGPAAEPSFEFSVFASVADLPDYRKTGGVPALVVLDPGEGVQQQLQIPWLRRKLARTTPILVVGSTIDTAAVFAEGAAAVLTKPLVREELLFTARELIRRKGWRILVADRDTDLRLLIKRSFEQRGFQVDDVDRGNLVLGRLEKEDYDLALMDLGFPDVSGTELLRVIRGNARLRTLPVFVMLDEARNPPSPQKLMSIGADQFVGKYQGIGGIVDAVTQFLEDRKMVEYHG